MISSAKSLFYFGIYVCITGLAVILLPDQLSSLLQLPSIPKDWGALIGSLAMIIGSYDMVAGHKNLQPFIKASIPVRILFFAATILIFVSGKMPISIVLLGSVDLLGALITWLALKKEATNPK
jgi:Na+/H+ antiporter NhaD/arsenite permease-like protein